MIIQVILSYIIVGTFYSAFSIFVRAILPSSGGHDPTKAANLLENCICLLLFFALMLSTTLNIQWAETGFRVISFLMG
jgi:hypothetical protein